MKAWKRFSPTAMGVVAALWVSACGPGDPAIRAAHIEKLTGDSSRGKAIYDGDVYPPCWSCHGRLGTGEGHRYPSLHRAAKEFTTSKIALQIMGGNEMRSFADKLTDQQIADVIAYLRAAFGS